MGGRRTVVCAPSPPAHPLTHPPWSLLANRAPKSTAQEVLRALGDLERIHLILAMQQTVGGRFFKRGAASTDYVDDLVKRVGLQSQQHGLSK